MEKLLQEVAVIFVDGTDAENDTRGLCKNTCANNMESTMFNFATTWNEITATNLTNC